MGRSKKSKAPKTLFSKRIARLFNGKNFSEFERNHGLSIGQISKMIDGVEPKLSTLEAVLKGTGCNPAWLILGEGEMEKEKEDE
jgi:hypothetical protein